MGLGFRRSTYDSLIKIKIIINKEKNPHRSAHDSFIKAFLGSLPQRKKKRKIRKK